MRRVSGRTPEDGQILILFALSLVVLLAGLALVLDGGRVFAQRRVAQNAADAAAMAGAAKLVASDPAGSLGAVLAAACATAYSNGGFGTGAVDAECGTTGSIVQVHVPGGDGGSALPNVNPVFEHPGYVQVAATSTFRSFMAGILGLGDFSASGLGVAVNKPGNGLGDVLLILDPVDCAALTLNGTLNLTVTGGDVMVDSSAAKSADTFCSNKNAAIKSGVGTGTLTNTSGANNIVGSGDANTVTPAWTNADYVADPLTRVTVPPFNDTNLEPTGTGTGTWDHPVMWQGMGTATAPAGVYWGGITVKNGDTLTLSGGTYIMAGGGFNLGGGNVTASAPVTLIYTRDPYCNSYVSTPPTACTSSVQKSGNLDGNHLDGSSSSVGETGGVWGGTPGAPAPLQAQVLSPDPYSLSGILIYVDRNALGPASAPCPATILNVGGNGAYYFATGTIIYGPCANVVLSGNVSSPVSSGGAVVSWQLTINGTKDMNLGGPSIGSGPRSQSNLVQ